MFGYFKNRRRQRLFADPLPDEWQSAIERNVAIYTQLSPEQRERVVQVVKVIVAERAFVGLKGLSISPEVRVTIAAQAALLLLGEDGYYFDRVPVIYVQPTLHETQTMHNLGSAVLVEDGVLVEGQAWQHEGIRLAWGEVLFGGRDAADGENVVLHEFAHHLDGLDGEVDGIPPLPTETQRRRWRSVFDAELTQHRRRVRRGGDIFLHEEAAESPAELFAYGTECFFEQPHELNDLHPDLFECLLGFYNVDPRTWFVNR